MAMRLFEKVLLLVACAGLSGNLSASSDEERLRELEIGLLLADRASIGVTQEVKALPPGSKWGYFVATVKFGELVKQVFMSTDIKQSSSIEIGKPAVFLYSEHLESDGISVLLLQMSPEMGIYPLLVTDDFDVESLRISLEREAGTFMNPRVKCRRDISQWFKLLGSSKFQGGVDQLLMTRPKTRRDFLCFVQEIQSRVPISGDSFTIPSALGGGVYHHSYTDRGQFVAGMLPLVMGARIFSLRTPLSDEERNRLAIAWSLWGQRKNWIKAHSGLSHWSNGVRAIDSDQDQWGQSGSLPFRLEEISSRL
ncbi:MAG: hypothetical protein SGJ19_29410 [Planctomycetia bacterium]|nr:hypothetical protein [Planctomycetia bacterium]